MSLVFEILRRSWDLLADSSVYILFGILIGGLLKVFLNPDFVIRHLGHGRITSVLKAALLGVPIPLCSCGVLPAAASLKRQGANNGATTAFLISTPESGVDSIAVSYALLDPLMTVARPIAGVVTALAAGVAENLASAAVKGKPVEPDLTCQVDGCCDGVDCPPDEHTHHHSARQKLAAGMRFAFGELWADLVGWYLVGLLLAGAVTSLVPAGFMSTYLGGGLASMLLMLVVGIPVYICATASTPIAAALILQGVSPGAALVFLLAGPATNITSLTVILKLLGTRAAAIYLGAIAVASVLFGMLLDAVYAGFDLSAQATVGRAAEMIPGWARLAGAAVLIAISIPPLYAKARALFKREPHRHGHTHLGEHAQKDGAEGCDCGGGKRRC